MASAENKKKSHGGLIATIIVLVVIIGAGIGIWYACQDRTDDSLSVENYTPNEEFAPAFNALNKPVEPQYDIEETVRILNGLEVAQYQSDDFFAFLEYMAKQDYSHVPQDVIDAKKRLMPILQRLFELQQQYDELDDIWMLVRSAGTGATNFAENLSPIGAMSAVFGGNPFETININRNLVEAKTAAFEQYENDQKLKESLRKEIDEVRMAYIDYLTDYAPVYAKYMTEWDKLCLERDKAYLDVYAGRTKDAYNAVDKVLKQYPTNREAMLLKALCLVQMAGTATNVSVPSVPADEADEVSADEADNEQPMLNESSFGDSIADSLYRDIPRPSMNRPSKNVNEYLSQADALLDNYMELYPNRSAPALVLKGLLNLKEGNETKAMSYLDQASVEYPRQAEALTDLLDSYKNRSYLNRSSEGKYLLRLYRSTMEGYGMFSPNLLKAKYYASQGKLEKSKEEIFNHFYRRGNQGVYDCLLSDMQYCEENMYSIFKQLLMEQSFIDVSVEPTTDWLVSKNDDEVKVIINNRSDVDLENVRIFLCLHYTDMYKDEYDVVKCPSINIIKHHDKTVIGVVKLNYEDKKYDDITRIRAIAMTDDKICWIDNVDYKYIHAYEAAKASAQSRKQSLSRREEFLNDFNINSQSLLSAITKGIKIYGDIKSGDKSLWNNVAGVFKSGKKLEIELPRILTLIDPVFSLNQLKDKDKAILPKENYLAGSNIRLKFDYEPKQGETIPLYIYSDYISFKVLLSFADGKASVKDISVIGE